MCELIELLVSPLGSYFSRPVIPLVLSAAGIPFCSARQDFPLAGSHWGIANSARIGSADAAVAQVDGSLLVPAPSGSETASVPFALTIIVPNGALGEKTVNATTEAPMATTGPNAQEDLVASTGSSTSSNSTSTEAAVIIGSLDLVYILGIVIAAWRTIYLRRKAAQAHTQEAPNESNSNGAEVVDPFSDAFRASWEVHGGPDLQSALRTTALTPSSSISSTRQLYISNQVYRAREKVRELEELSSLLLHSARNSGVSSEGSHGALNHPAGVENEPTVDDRLQRALQEIEALNLRIQEMERQRESDWALGISDEFPPIYTELE
ncbi:hypothetical protein FB45DRAFT_1067239 [Roridomyces roridus]|uniref:Uncharacterized protein n=1 Tax=Roridomyces roridus TaxID=1738132 RepID=A0AAD7B3D2_9AGAR|nr:hypothetical protein FB45DRAFT_1067239 [Roridomyces roridus]